MAFNSIYLLLAVTLLSVSAQLSHAGPDLGLKPSKSQPVDIEKKSLDIRQNKSRQDLKGSESIRLELKIHDGAPKALELKKIEQLKSSQMLQGGGVVDTGGGSLIGSAKVDAKEVLGYLAQVKWPSLYILRRLEIVLSSADEPGSQELYKKLFLGKRTIYHALIDADLQYLPVGAGSCNIEGEDKAAHVLDYPGICFSLDEMTSSLNKDSVQAEILALFIHEISHFVGVNHPDNQVLQKMVKSSLSNNPFQKIPKLVEKFETLRAQTRHSAEALIQEMDSLPPSELYAGLTIFLSQVDSLYNESMESFSDTTQYGISFLGKKELTFVQVAKLKSLNMLTCCSTSIPYYETIKSSFRGRNSVSLKEFSEFFNLDAPPDSVSGMPILALHDGIPEARRKENLKRELIDIRNLLATPDL